MCAGGGGLLLPWTGRLPLRMALALVVDGVNAVVKPAEDHFAGSGLKNAGYGNVDGAGYHLFGVVHHHHGAVVQISDALVVLFAFFENKHAHRFTRQHDGLERVSQLIDVQDLDAVKLGNFVQVEIVGHDLAVVNFGELDQLHVHFRDIGEVILENLNVKLGHLLDALQNVQAAASAIALERIGRVRHQLQFAEYELGDYQRTIQETRLNNVGDATVDNNASIQD